MIKIRINEGGLGCTHASHRAQDMNNNGASELENECATSPNVGASTQTACATTPSKSFQSFIEGETLDCPPPPTATRAPMVIKNRRRVMPKDVDTSVDLSKGIVVAGTVVSKKVPPREETTLFGLSTRGRAKSQARTKDTTDKNKKVNKVNWFTDSLSKEQAKPERKDLKIKKMLEEATDAAEEVAASTRSHARGRGAAAEKDMSDGHRTRGASRKRKDVGTIEQGHAMKSSKRTKIAAGSKRAVSEEIKRNTAASKKTSKPSNKKTFVPKSASAIKKQALRLASSSSQELKPLFEVNDRVYAPWWPDAARKSEPSWFAGVIIHYETLERNGKFGPIRFYTVRFEDDNSVSKGIIDACVFDREDYLISMSFQGDDSDDEHEWIGVKNVLDKRSSDTWAKSVGWYETIIDGKKYCFAKLVHALRAYDAHVVTKHGGSTHSSELNLPDETLRQNSRPK